MGLSFTSPILTGGRDARLEREVGHAHDHECKVAAAKASILMRLEADVMLWVRYQRRGWGLVLLGDDRMPGSFGWPRFVLRRLGDLLRGLWYVLAMANLTAWAVTWYGLGRVGSLKMGADEMDSNAAGMFAVAVATVAAVYPIIDWIVE